MLGVGVEPGIRHIQVRLHSALVRCQYRVKVTGFIFSGKKRHAALLDHPTEQSGSDRSTAECLIQYCTVFSLELLAWEPLIAMSNSNAKRVPWKRGKEEIEPMAFHAGKFKKTY